jgi:RND family efflux transporter MFP subunit
MSRISRRGLRLLAAASACFTLTALADGPPGAPERVVVEVGTVSARPLAFDSWIPGSIVSRADARIASVIAGRVIWIADVGTRVKQGEPLARLDDTLPRLRVDDLRAQVARARSQHDVATTQLERFNRLAATQALSASQLDDARSQREVSGDDVTRAEAQLRQAQYEIDQSVIRAPFPGVVSERFIQRGEYLQVGAATVRLVNTADTEARATAALELAANVHPGQTVTVRDHGVTKSGTVRTVVPVGDDRSRQFEVRVTLASAEWLVGEPVEVSIPASSQHTALSVPRDALVIRANRSYVLRVTSAGTVEELDVVPGLATAESVEVRGPLAAGDRLVVRGAERLTAGQAVRVLGQAPRTAHAGGSGTRAAGALRQCRKAARWGYTARAPADSQHSLQGRPHERCPGPLPPPRAPPRGALHRAVARAAAAPAESLGAAGSAERRAGRAHPHRRLPHPRGGGTGDPQCRGARAVPPRRCAHR